MAAFFSYRLCHLHPFCHVIWVTVLASVDRVQSVWKPCTFLSCSVKIWNELIQAKCALGVISAHLSICSFLSKSIFIALIYPSCPACLLSSSLVQQPFLYEFTHLATQVYERENSPCKEYQMFSSVSKAILTLLHCSCDIAPMTYWYLPAYKVIYIIKPA